MTVVPTSAMQQAQAMVGMDNPALLLRTASFLDASADPTCSPDALNAVRDSVLRCRIGEDLGGLAATIVDGVLPGASPYVHRLNHVIQTAQSQGLTEARIAWGLPLEDGTPVVDGIHLSGPGGRHSVDITATPHVNDTGVTVILKQSGVGFFNGPEVWNTNWPADSLTRAAQAAHLI